MEKKRRRPISEKQRQRIRQYAAANPQIDQRSIAQWASREFDRAVTQSMISRSLTTTYAYLDTKVFHKREKDGCKRRVPVQYPQLEAALFDWVVTMEYEKLTVTGDLIRSAASQIWARMLEFKDREEPRWSEGWLQGFKHRYNIRKRVKYGESGSVDVAGAQQRMKEVQVVVNDYDAKDIYNADEAALHWLLMPNSTLATRAVHGTKQDKRRITLLPCSNATGEDKLDMWVIGQSMNPRCFGSHKQRIQHLPIQYRNNKTAWMTGEIFKEWLSAFKVHVLRDDPHRKVLLLLDGFSAHLSGLREWQEKSGHPGIRVEFLPGNATSLYQPMDQGIIRNLKLYYRKQLLENMVHHTLSGRNPLKEIDLLQCIQWLLHSWRSHVSSSTIANCWRKSEVFGKMYGPEPAPTGWNAQLEELRTLTETLGIKEPVNMEEYVEPEDERVCDTGDDLQKVADAYSEVQPEIEEEETEEEERPPVTAKAALAALDTLLLWEKQQDHPNSETTKSLDRLAARVGKKRLQDLQQNAAQTTLHDFFQLC